jgi:hypothetical protein
LHRLSGDSSIGFAADIPRDDDRKTGEPPDGDITSLGEHANVIDGLNVAGDRAAQRAVWLASQESLRFRDQPNRDRDRVPAIAA